MTGGQLDSRGSEQSRGVGTHSQGPRQFYSLQKTEHMLYEIDKKYII